MADLALDDTQLTPQTQSAPSAGTRSQRRGPKCHPANVTFYDRLTELKNCAESEGRIRQCRNFTRAMQSLQRYPLALKSAHDVMLLEGMGKVFASIFQEALEARGSLDQPVDQGEQDSMWRTAIRRRWLREMGRRAKNGGPNPATITQQRRWGRWPRKSKGLDGGSQVDDCQKRSAKEKEDKGVELVPVSASVASEEISLAVCCESEPNKEEQLQLIPIDAAQVHVPAKPPARAVCRPSLAAACRRDAAARINAPAVGSAGWCLLVSLGLYGAESHDRALSRNDVQRCIERQLRPEVPGCKKMRWSVTGSLKNRGLLEELETERFRLTPRGASMAEGLVRKLEVPLTALSPLRVSVAARTDNQQSPDDDDKPLTLLALSPGARASASSSRPDDAGLQQLAPGPAEIQCNESPHEISSRPCERVLFDTDHNVAASHSKDVVDPHLSQFEFRPVETKAAAQVAHREPKRRRLSASLSAPPLPSPIRKSPKRRLAPARSAPTPPRAGLQHTMARTMTRPTKEARLVLLLDHREVGAGREHKARGALLEDLASRLGADAVEGRSLPLGDVLWIWRDKDNEGAQHEFLAGWVVERKTFQDLSTSIMDGRYDEQKTRLLEAPGLDGIVYLIEGAGPLFGVSEASTTESDRSARAAPRGFGHRLIQRALPIATLSTTAAHIQFISGFHVAHATNTAHTLSILSGLHESIRNRGPRRNSVTAEIVQYQTFAECTRKSCHPRVFEAFGRMLRMVPHCGPEATEALVDEFLTPHAFATALRDTSDKELLLRLKERRGGRAPVTAATLAACRELFTE